MFGLLERAIFIYVDIEILSDIISFVMSLYKMDRSMCWACLRKRRWRPRKSGTPGSTSRSSKRLVPLFECFPLNILIKYREVLSKHKKSKSDTKSIIAKVIYKLIS